VFHISDFVDFQDCQFSDFRAIAELEWNTSEASDRAGLPLQHWVGKNRTAAVPAMIGIPQSSRNDSERHTFNVAFPIQQTVFGEDAVRNWATCIVWMWFAIIVNMAAP
jgi:hypothetical protein